LKKSRKMAKIRQNPPTQVLSFAVSRRRDREDMWGVVDVALNEQLTA
jgi:hypothetical protein